ncbi:MAG: hypothetical protein GYA52_01025 [Chloroflexi bacterium]|nr:hypothetical protein [Chloroflexota bacterium]
MKNIFQKNFHFLFLSIYFPLFLYVNNIEQIDIIFILRSLIISAGLSVILFMVLRLITKNNNFAAVITSIAIFLFFIYGSVYQYFEQQGSFLRILGRHRFLTPLFIIVFVVAIILLKKQKDNIRQPIILLNLFSLFLIMPLLFNICQYHIKIHKAQLISNNESPIDHQDEGITNPDIYYIILDTYARNDALHKIGIDNDNFLQTLADKGFYIADCSDSNYFFTSLSLTSSLNFEYIKDIDPIFTPENTDETLLDSYLKNNKVRSFLENSGYTTIAFETGYYWSSWKDANIYLQPDQTNVDMIVGSKINEFEAMLIHSTGLLSLLDSSSKFVENYFQDIHFPYSNHINRELFIIESLKEIPKWDSPKFVFAHILIPHYPYVFSSEGEILTDPGYWDNPADRGTPINEKYFLSGYSNQVDFISNEIIAIVDRILEDSKNEAIIIIQGDTGIKEPLRQAILNAYYFPDGDYSALYATISPVNTFRVVLNQFFSTNYPYLVDETYYSTYELPYETTLMDHSNAAQCTN